MNFKRKIEPLQGLGKTMHLYSLECVNACTAKTGATVGYDTAGLLDITGTTPPAQMFLTYYGYDEIGHGPMASDLNGEEGAHFSANMLTVLRGEGKVALHTDFVDSASGLSVGDTLTARGGKLYAAATGQYIHAVVAKAAANNYIELEIGHYGVKS